MKRAAVQEAVKLTVDGVEAFYEKTVTAFGTGAKIDCPRQYLGRNVYVVIRRPKKE
jgi:putative transposon-encoded protein